MTVAVGIIMGSDSDLPVMQGAADILDELGVAHEMTVVSAHRTPHRLYEYAAGILAAQMLSTGDAALRARLADYKRDLRDRVLTRAATLSRDR